MINANQLKNGSTIILDGDLYNVIGTHHVKPGKGGAFVSTKVKKISDGTIVNKTLRAQDKIKIAFIEEKKFQYLYKKTGIYYFMDLETYEQRPVNEKQIEHIKDFLKENTNVTVKLYENKIIDIVLPTFINLKVKQTQPGVRGNTAQGGIKPAQLETGVKIQVPLFVDKGDKVKVDTRSGEYVERV